MIINKVKNEIKNIFVNDASGHDYWHSERVYKNAMKIAEKEGGDKFLIALAALLHDVDDDKIFPNNNYTNAKNIMDRCQVEKRIQKEVVNIIKDVAFRGSDSAIPHTVEGKIVQDADRLDALGAIGIARTFAFGGNRNRCIYDPNIAPKLNMNAFEYSKNTGTSVNHFFEKLFKLKRMMNTKTAREEAKRRDIYMRNYMEQFLAEWKGI